MDDRFNTIAGWVLGAGIVALGASIVTAEIFHAERPEKMGYPIEGVVEEGAGGAAAEQPIAFYLASADVAKGEAAFKKCAACHTVNQGGANGIGPNLWGTVGKAKASHAGFAYSDALKSKGGTWTFDDLAAWLKSPKAYAPGNKMSFAGLGKPEDRANVIAYLNSQGSNLPLPAVPAEVAEAAPATTAPAGPEQAAAAEKGAVLPSKAPDVVEATRTTAVARGGPGAEDVAGRAKDDRNDQ